MKNLRILFVLLLALLGASNVAAQEIADGEAFYIYRNDGDFDGFFYDQVEEMRYSKLGVDSVEYDEYVTYEVVTADSLYRIPLETIDSISFVQPEIEFNPEVRHMDLLGMSEYITAVDGMTLTFDTSLPFALRPKEGNVLLGFTGLLEENGFGGRVQSVSVAGDKIIVSCGQLEKFSDIFKRFISVEEVGADENGKPLTRRIAGYRSMMVSARRASDGLTTNLLDVSMNTHLKLLPDGFLYHANVDLSLALKIRLAMVYRVEADDAFFKVMLMESFSLQAGIDLGVDGSDFKKIACVPTFGIKFPAGLYLFEIRPVPEFGVRYGGDISFKAKFPSFTRAFRQTWVMDSSNSDGMRYEGNGMDAGPAQSVSEFFSDAGMGITFSGFVQVGIKTSCAVYTNSWVEKIFNAGVGVDFFIGPKVEGSILGVSGSVSDLTDGYYLLRNNKLSGTWLALDFEAFGEHQFCSGPKHRYTFADGSFALLPRWEMAMLPTVDMKKAEYKDGMVNAEMETNECCVFWNSDLGFAIMDKEAKNILASDYLQNFKFGSEVPFLLTTSFSVKDYKPGIYQVAPLMKMSLSTKEFPIKSQAKEVKIPVWLEVPSVVQAPAEGGTVTIPAETNADLHNTNVVTVPQNTNLAKKEISATVVASTDEPGFEAEYGDVTIQQSGSDVYQAVIELGFKSPAQDYSVKSASFSINLFGKKSPDDPNRLIFNSSSTDNSLNLLFSKNEEIKRDKDEIMWVEGLEPDALSWGWDESHQWFDLPYGVEGVYNNSGVGQHHISVSMVVDVSGTEPIIETLDVSEHRNLNFSTSGHSTITVCSSYDEEKNECLAETWAWTGTYSEQLQYAFDATIKNITGRNENYGAVFGYKTSTNDEHIFSFSYINKWNATKILNNFDFPSQKLVGNRDESFGSYENCYINITLRTVEDEY